MKKVWLSGWTKALLFALCLVPLFNLLWRGYKLDLTANPIEFITHATGDWTLRLLLITLAITPLRTLLNQPQLIRFRRMLGLFAFFYGLLHLATWMWLDKGFDVGEMWADVVKRRFITAGMTGLLLMVPLAVTSTAGWVRRLGYVQMATAAPGDLFQRAGWGDSLLLGREVRYPAAGAVWHDSGGSHALPRGRVDG